MKTSLVILLLVCGLVYADDQLSESSSECLDCHLSIHPGIVADWKNSRHAKTTVTEALQLSDLNRRISVDSVAADLSAVYIGCYECHGLNSADHADNFEHFGFSINVIVSPEDCATCHPQEVEQYSESKKAYANEILAENPLFNSLVEEITSVKSVRAGAVVHGKVRQNSQNETCYACHGTKIEVAGMLTMETEFGEIEIPELKNWPNQGVGRINPDGSRGACTSCHPRHSFSITMARKPYTCAQCHLHPDVPAWEVYKESKHGNIFQSLSSHWNWDNVPWEVGADFTAPTCATCHVSLVTGPGEEIIAERDHDFAARLWVRIFGLIYTHPQPKHGATFKIKNSAGLPMPTDFEGNTADAYLIDSGEYVLRENKMRKVCQSCHNAQWLEGHFEKLDETIAETDLMTRAATNLVKYAWNNKINNGLNPFDEPLENLWIRQWLFYANSVRYGSAMSGPDYATFKNGWFEMSSNLKQMENMIKLTK